MESLNAVQPNLSMSIISQVWIPFLTTETPVRKVEAKVQVLGLSKVLFETPALLSDATGRLAWVKGLACLVAIITSPSLRSSGEVHEEGDESFEEMVEYDAQFSQLQYARVPVQDPFPIADPIQTFSRSMQSLSVAHPGQLAPLIQEGLRDDPKALAGLETLLKSSNISLA